MQMTYNLLCKSLKVTFSCCKMNDNLCNIKDAFAIQTEIITCWKKSCMKCITEVMRHYEIVEWEIIS